MSFKVCSLRLVDVIWGPGRFTGVIMLEASFSQLQEYNSNEREKESLLVIVGDIHPDRSKF